MNPEILFEIKLKKAGAWLTPGLLIGSAIFIVPGIILVAVLPFPDSLFLFLWLGLCFWIFGVQLWRILPLRKNPGDYRIWLDDYGFYVHSDAPSIQPPFSVVATDLQRLVHKIVVGDSDDHYYYIETKSGKRYQLEELLLQHPNPTPMQLFHKIINRFHWVEMVEERQR